MLAVEAKRQRDWQKQAHVLSSPREATPADMIPRMPLAPDRMPKLAMNLKATPMSCALTTFTISLRQEHKPHPDLITNETRTFRRTPVRAYHLADMKRA